MPGDDCEMQVHQDAKSATPDKLAQSYVVCPLDKKLSTLWGFIKTHLKAKSIIFLASCKQVCGSPLSQSHQCR